MGTLNRKELKISEKELKRLQAWIPNELYAKAKLLSERQGRTITDVVNQALREYVSDGNIQQAIDELRARLTALENKK